MHAYTVNCTDRNALAGSYRNAIFFYPLWLMMQQVTG